MTQPNKNASPNIQRLLIANRGEIACRIMRTAKAMGIETVAVYADSDAESLAVRNADFAVALHGQTSAQTYLDSAKIIAAAKSSGANAVHPGYGFLSENADFAQAIVDAGLIWVGPPASAIRAVGSKAGAKQLAQQQGVPCLPGYYGDDQSDGRFKQAAQEIGYPVMVKAIAGGGGRGMRWVDTPEQLGAALQSARSEALSSFGSDALLIERALRHPRHVEVQIFADSHGHCIHLGERDCSVQRRHQKVIEESPSPAVSDALRDQMGQSAIALAQGAGYVGAGTVEFLLDGDAYYLMEMNTRLQVEHPVTEALTGLDLVEWQLRVANGEILPLEQDEIRLQGHAIEVRLCAEDAQFHPHTGQVLALHWPTNKVRVEHGLQVGDEVSPYFDSMLAKIIVHAPTRAEALMQMRAALQDTLILGLPTNRAMLRSILQYPDFMNGHADIAWLEKAADILRRQLAEQNEQASALGVIAVWAMQVAPNSNFSDLPCVFERPVLMVRETANDDVAIPLPLRELGNGRIAVQWQGAEEQAQIKVIAPHTVLVQWQGVQHKVHVAAQAAQTGPKGSRWQVQTTQAEFFIQDRSLVAARSQGSAHAELEVRAPFNGKVLAVMATIGETVVAGSPLVVLESMKLEHTVTTRHAGVIAECAVKVGQQVAPGQLLCRFVAHEDNPKVAL